MQNENLKEKKIDLVTTDESVDTPEASAESTRDSGQTAGTSAPSGTNSDQSDLSPDQKSIDQDFPNFGERYQPLATIGHGGMGLVYKAKDSVTGSIVAIKVLKKELTADKTALRRFEQEVASLTELDHESLVALYGQGQTLDGAPYLVMEYIEGKSLSALLEQEKKLSPERAIDLILQIADGLAHAHKKGIIHRDLKPSNIMICRPESPESASSDAGAILKDSVGSSSNETVRILDFGIARILESTTGSTTSLTQTGDVFGTPNYMSPEQCEGKPIDSTSDIYSLGCMLYELLTGKLPFEGSNPIQVAVKHINDKPPGFPTEKKRKRLKQPLKSLESITLFCLGKNKGARYRSIEELSKDLRRVKAGKRVTKVVDLTRTSHMNGTISAAATMCLATFFILGNMSHDSILNPNSHDSAAITIAMTYAITFVCLNIYCSTSVTFHLFRDRAAFRSYRTMQTFWNFTESSLLCITMWTLVLLYALSAGFEVGSVSSSWIATPLGLVALISGTLVTMLEFAGPFLSKFKTKFLDITFSKKAAQMQSIVIGAVFCAITILTSVFCPNFVSFVTDSFAQAYTPIAPHIARLLSNAALTLEPQSARALENKAAIDLTLHNSVPVVLSDLNNAIKQFPENAEIIAARAKIYNALPDREKAIADYTSAIALVDKAEWYTLRGAVNVASAKYQAALSDYTEALKRDPTIIALYTKRGVVYAELKDYKLSIADLSTAIASATEYESTDAYLRRGIVKELAGDNKSASKDFASVLKNKNEKDSDSRLFVYKKLGMEKEYRELLDTQKEKRSPEELRQAICDRLFKDGPALPFTWQPLKSQTIHSQP